MKKRKMRRRIAELETRIAALERQVFGSVVPDSYTDTLVEILVKENPYRAIFRGKPDA